MGKWNLMILSTLLKAMEPIKRCSSVSGLMVGKGTHGWGGTMGWVGKSTGPVSGGPWMIIPVGNGEPLKKFWALEWHDENGCIIKFFYFYSFTLPTLWWEVETPCSVIAGSDCEGWAEDKKAWTVWPYSFHACFGGPKIIECILNEWLGAAGLRCKESESWKQKDLDPRPGSATLQLWANLLMSNDQFVGSWWGEQKPGLAMTVWLMDFVSIFLNNRWMDCSKPSSASIQWGSSNLFHKVLPPVNQGLANTPGSHRREAGVFAVIVSCLPVSYATGKEW